MVSRGGSITLESTRVQSQEMRAVNKEPQVLCGSLRGRFSEGSGERWGLEVNRSPTSHAMLRNLEFSSRLKSCKQGNGGIRYVVSLGCC